MIIGNGLLASAFIPYFSENTGIIIFASGVSNSQETRQKEFLREKMLLLDALRYEKFIIYFSSCSIYDHTLFNTSYVLHKKEMEILVCSAKNYVIFRLPQVVGKTSNPHVLTNYLYKQITLDNPFQVWCYAKRNLIDVDDVAIIAHFLYHNGTANKSVINIANPFSITAMQLVNIFESILEKKALFTLIESGNSYTIDASLSEQAAQQLGLKFDELYVENLIRKYYGSKETI